MADFIPTKASMMQKNAKKKFSVTTFTSRKSNAKPAGEVIKKQDSTKDETVTETREEQEKRMKRLRFEVMKFGMSGLSRENALQANMELAIKLGAKPPKNKRQNYKRLMEAKKQEAEERKKKEQFSSGFEGSLLNMKKFKKKTDKSSKQRKDKGILGKFGKVEKREQK